MNDRDKTNLLARLFEGNLHAGAELRLLVRQRLALETDGQPVRARTVAELRSRALAIRHGRERANAEKAATERARLQEEAEKAQGARLNAIAQREIETEIERRNAGGYDRAASLLAGLRLIAEERGGTEAFTQRLRAIRERHAKKGRFIGRLSTIG